MSVPVEPLPPRAGRAWDTMRGAWPGAVSVRERRTLAIAGVVLAVAVLIAYGVLPFARRWTAREAVMDAREAQLARVRGLVAAESTLAAAVRARTARSDRAVQRPLSTRTPALAAASLQAALQSAAVTSGVQVQRVDVADGDAEAAVGSIPATLAAVGDVYGLAALLDALQHGPTLLEVATLGVQATPGPRGEALLQLTVTVRAPWRGAVAAVPSPSPATTAP